MARDPIAWSVEPDRALLFVCGADLLPISRAVEGHCRDLRGAVDWLLGGHDVCSVSGCPA